MYFSPNYLAWTIYDCKKWSFVYFKSSEIYRMVLNCGAALHFLVHSLNLLEVNKKITLEWFFLVCFLKNSISYYITATQSFLTSCVWLWLRLLSFLIFNCSAEPAVKLNRTMWRRPSNSKVFGNVCCMSHVRSLRGNLNSKFWFGNKAKVVKCKQAGGNL